LSSEILVNASEFERARSALLSSYLNMHSALQRLEQKNAELRRNWEGQSGSAFQNLAEVTERLFDVSNEQLKEMMSDMDMAEQGFTELDNEIQAQFILRSQEGG